MLNPVLSAGFDEKALPWWEQNRVRQLISSTKTQKRHKKIEFFSGASGHESENGSSGRLSRCKSPNPNSIKTDQNYNYEIDERFCCTAAFEEADE